MYLKQLPSLVSSLVALEIVGNQISNCNNHHDGTDETTDESGDAVPQVRNPESH